MCKVYDHSQIEWQYLGGIFEVSSNTAYRIAAAIAGLSIHPVLEEGAVDGEYMVDYGRGADLHNEVKHVPNKIKIHIRMRPTTDSSYEFYQAHYPVETDVIVGEYPKKNHYVQYKTDTDQIIIHRNEVTYE